MGVNYIGWRRKGVQMNDNRDTFIFYRSFKESMNDLSDKDKLTMYEAISDYSLDLKEPILSGFPKALFTLIRPILDANTQRWRNAKKGGAPKGNSNRKGKGKTTKNQPNINQESTEHQPNKDKDVDKDVDKEYNISTKVDKEKVLSLADRTEKFKEELTQFVGKYGKDMVFAFFDYWSEPNPSKTKMRFEMQKTWDIAKRLRTWERRNNEKR